MHDTLEQRNESVVVINYVLDEVATWKSETNTHIMTNKQASRASWKLINQSRIPQGCINSRGHSSTFYSDIGGEIVWKIPIYRIVQNAILLSGQSSIIYLSFSSTIYVHHKLDMFKSQEDSISTAH